MKKKYNISVIVPIYNTEKYIGKCVESLFLQDMKSLELIFVDDGSTDNSISIIESLLETKYSYRKDFVTIILLGENKGIANARNVGIKKAHGDYIGFVDSDDWIDENMFSVLYDKAKKKNSDIVACNLLREYPARKSFSMQPYTTQKDVNIRRMLVGAIFPSLCCEIVKRSLYEEYNISFISKINMGEDLLVNIQLFFYSNVFSYVDNFFYHYRSNDASVCHVRSMESIRNDIAVAKYIEGFFVINGVVDIYYKELLCRKFFAKLPLYTSEKYRDIKLWKSIFPETNGHIFSYPRLDWKMKIEYWLASHHLFMIAHLFVFLIKVKNVLHK